MNTRQTLINQATKGCHDDFEAFFNMAYTLAEQLVVPFPAQWLGSPVTVVAIDVERSSLCQGIKARLAAEEKPIPLAELEFGWSTLHNEAWLAAFRQWDLDR